MPPLPYPDKIRGTELVAVFEVDEKGNVLTFTFTETKDRGYNRRLREVLAEIRWRPAVRSDGTPVRHRGEITYLF